MSERDRERLQVLTRVREIDDAPQQTRDVEVTDRSALVAQHLAFEHVVANGYPAADVVVEQVVPIPDKADGIG
jgi:hypothetical protein